MHRRLDARSLRPEPLSSETATLQILHDLYESKINYSISCLWDGGYHVKLGNKLWNDEVSNLRSWIEVAEWLKTAAIRHYPNSTFARIYI